MSKYALLSVVGLCVALFSLPTYARSQHDRDHGDRVCIYKDSNFHGHEQCYRRVRRWPI